MENNKKKLSDKEKLVAILQYLRLKIAEFAIKINASPDHLYNLNSGKIGEFSQEVRIKILQSCPEISPIWLLTGEGDMLVSSPSSSSPASDATAKSGRSQSEPSMLSRFEEVVRENERLRLELESLRSSVSRRVEEEEAVSFGSREPALT